MEGIILANKGATQLIKKAKSIFKEKSIETTLTENGFIILAKELPYSFHINCVNSMGWNIYLTSLSGNYEDHQESDAIYYQLEEIVDKINEDYFSVEDESLDYISYNFFKLKTLTEETLLALSTNTKINDTGTYILKVSSIPEIEDFLELGFSTQRKEWYYHVKKDTPLNNPPIQNYLEEIDCLITSFNQRL